MSGWKNIGAEVQLGMLLCEPNHFQELQVNELTDDATEIPCRQVVSAPI